MERVGGGGTSREVVDLGGGSGKFHAAARRPGAIGIKEKRIAEGRGVGADPALRAENDNARAVGKVSNVWKSLEARGVEWGRTGRTQSENSPDPSLGPGPGVEITSVEGAALEGILSTTAEQRKSRGRDSLGGGAKGSRNRGDDTFGIQLILGEECV